MPLLASNAVVGGGASEAPVEWWTPLVDNYNVLGLYDFYTGHGNFVDPAIVGSLTYLGGTYNWSNPDGLYTNGGYLDTGVTNLLNTETTLMAFNRGGTGSANYVCAGAKATSGNRFYLMQRAAGGTHRFGWMGGATAGVVPWGIDGLVALAYPNGYYDGAYTSTGLSNSPHTINRPIWIGADNEGFAALANEGVICTAAIIDGIVSKEHLDFANDTLKDRYGIT